MDRVVLSLELLGEDGSIVSAPDRFSVVKCVQAGQFPKWIKNLLWNIILPVDPKRSPSTALCNLERYMSCSSTCCGTPHEWNANFQCRFFSHSF